MGKRQIRMRIIINCYINQLQKSDLINIRYRVTLA